MTAFARLMPHPTARKDDRRSGIGGTDARRIMAGEWHALWMEKTGRRASEDLSRVFRVQLGLVTEDLHARFHHYDTGDKLLSMPDAPTTRADFGDLLKTIDKAGLLGVLYATYDRWVEGDDIPLEMKHTNERNNLRDAAEYYMPQLQLQMLIAGVSRIRFSIIRGNSNPEWGYVAADAEYQAMMLRQLDAFWYHVTADDEPPADEVKGAAERAAAAKAAKEIPLNGFKPYDMTGDNEWSAAARQFIADKLAAEGLKESEKKIRGMIPADAETVTSKELSFKRDARGAYRVSIDDATAAEIRHRQQLGLFTPAEED